MGIPPGEGAHPAPDEADSSSIVCQTTGPPQSWMEKDGMSDSCGKFRDLKEGVKKCGACVVVVRGLDKQRVE